MARTAGKGKGESMKREWNTFGGSKAVLAAAAAVAAGLAMTGTAQVQATLFGSQYVQDFNSIGTGLPTGWTVNTGADVGGVGTAGAFATGVKQWSDTAGAFKNFASSNDPTLTSSSTSTQQAGSGDRRWASARPGRSGTPAPRLSSRSTTRPGSRSATSVSTWKC